MESTTTTNVVAAATSATSASPALASFKLEDRVSFIRAFSATAPVIPGYRNCRIGYRNTDAKKPAKAPKLVTIPEVILPEAFDLLPSSYASVFRGVIEDTQDSLIRDLIENGSNVILWDCVSIHACLESLCEVRKSQRLTKEDIFAYVDSVLAGVIKQRAMQISEAKQHNEIQQAAQLAATTQTYRDGFGKLAAPVPNLDQGKATALHNMLVLAGVTDAIGVNMKAKLHAILNPVGDDDDNI